MGDKRGRRPRTRLDGAITVGGVEYATEAELEQALGDKVRAAGRGRGFECAHGALETSGAGGYRLTAAGEAYLQGWRDAQPEVA